jgi:hypothetical protein
MKTLISLLAVVGLVGCSTASKNISASYISPLTYQNFDCAQLTAEATRVNTRANQLAGRLDEAAANDKALVGVSLLLFWPAAFALGGTKEQEAAFARLKGERDAIEQTMIQKKCAMPTPTPTPAPTPEAAPKQ